MEMSSENVVLVVLLQIGAKDLTVKWSESSPPNIGVNSLNPRGLKCDNRKSYVGGWIYPEYYVAWLISVVGFVS